MLLLFWFNKKYPDTPFAVILPVAFDAYRKVLTKVDREWILPRLKWWGANLEFLLKTNEFGDGGEKGNSDKYKYCCECEWGKVVVDFKVREKIEKTDGSGYWFIMFSFCYFMKLQAWHGYSQTWISGSWNCSCLCFTCCLVEGGFLIT